ncbi:unnamed protein product [Rodentolepis nana]|uniref:Secreted protein n=1 Tax=Rodentolepis nana TaxID=102285 RepID=A0A0R3TPQ1_RODNA|nr:unnamed protein product [Rodentolepis nana]
MACLRPADCRLLVRWLALGQLIVVSNFFFVFRSSSLISSVAKDVPFSFQFLKVFRPKLSFFSVPQGVWTKTAFFLVPQGV